MPLAFPWPCLPPAGYLKIFFVGGGVQLERKSASKNSMECLRATGCEEERTVVVGLPGPPSEPSPAPHPSQARRPALIHRLLFWSQGPPPFPGPCPPVEPLADGACPSSAPQQPLPAKQASSGRGTFRENPYLASADNPRPRQAETSLESSPLHPTPRLRREEPQGPR